MDFSEVNSWKCKRVCICLEWLISRRNYLLPRNCFWETKRLSTNFSSNRKYSGRDKNRVHYNPQAQLRALKLKPYFPWNKHENAQWNFNLLFYFLWNAHGFRHAPGFTGRRSQCLSETVSRVKWAMLEEARDEQREIRSVNNFRVLEHSSQWATITGYNQIIWP